jgi:tetratricopeptide (TPR) repeat protein
MAAAILLATNFHLEAHAQLIPGYPDDVIGAMDGREVALLPEYCKYSQQFRERVPGGNNATEMRRWYALLGDTFHHAHHYCFGLMYTNRALHLARSKRVRDFYLGVAIKEYDYVLQRAPSDFPLLPEILTKKGENLIRLGEGVLGELELQRALALKPDYSPAYGALSDYHRNLGDLDKARQVLEEGLTLAPDSGSLKRRLAALQSPPPQPSKPRTTD